MQSSSSPEDSSGSATTGISPKSDARDSTASPRRASMGDVLCETPVRGTRREHLRHTLRVETQLAGPIGPVPTRWSSIGATGVSPTPSTPDHSPHGSAASYTPLRSARGSLSLGGTAHHSFLSRGSSLHQSVSHEALVLPLVGTGELILVPDAVASRSPLCASTTVNGSGQTAAPTMQSQREFRPRRRIRKHSARTHELCNAAVLMGTSGALFITALTIYFVMAVPNEHKLPTVLHVFIVGIILLLLGLTCFSASRFQKILKHRKMERTESSQNGTRRSRGVPITETEESLIPSSPIMVQYEADDDEEESAERGQKHHVRPPPPAYGRWRESFRMDPNLLHWQRVEGPGEDARIVNSDEPPVYASPLRTRRAETSQDSGGEMTEIGRAL